jgi:predicted transcriptional regulator
MATGEEALEHETRRMIYNHIISHPGVSYKVLKTVFSLTDGTLRYHLDYLERAEKISFGLEAGKRLYYPFHSEVTVASQLPGTAKPYKLTQLQERILNTIKQHPGITQKELMTSMGLKRFTIVNNVKKLLNLEIIRKTPNGKNVYYEYITNEQFRYELLKGLVIKLLKKEIDENTFINLKRKLGL